jgi:uncharacterized protein involved in response to NO
MLPCFSYGFRTFFLLAALAAIGLMTIWGAVLLGVTWAGDIPAHLWHGHEMLFAFVDAAIGGFLLTAVPSWTGAPAIAGSSLLALAILWFAGRIASLPPFAPSILAGVIAAFAVDSASRLCLHPDRADTEACCSTWIRLGIRLAACHYRWRLHDH